MQRPKLRDGKSRIGTEFYPLGTQDALQKAGVLEDDSMNHVVPVFMRKDEGYGWALDRKNPRIEIEIVQIKGGSDDC